MALSKHKTQNYDNALIGILGTGIFVTLILIVALSGLRQPSDDTLFVPTVEPTASSTPPPTSTTLPTLTPSLTPTPSSTPTPTPSPTPTPDEIANPPGTHNWLSRPFDDEDGGSVQRTYPYGSTMSGQLDVHHGVEFPGPMNQPIYAVGEGTVVVAGEDKREKYGPDYEFYGKLVVARLDRTYRGQPVFTLFGHLDEIAVQPGQPVRAGDKIGAIGMTGVAQGPHLHFEVRVGQNDYSHTRNPELWIKPHPGTGIIAGRAHDSQGQPLKNGLALLYPANKPDEFYRQTEIYGPGVHPDDVLSENFLFGDVPAGDYIVRLYTSSQAIPVHLADGQTVVVEIGME